SRSCRPPERRRRGAGWRAAGATAGPTRSRRPRPTRRRCAPRPAASASRSGLPGPTGPGTGLPGPIGPGTGLPGPTGPGTGLPGPTGPGPAQPSGVGSRPTVMLLSPAAGFCRVSLVRLRRFVKTCRRGAGRSRSSSLPRLVPVAGALAIFLAALQAPSALAAQPMPTPSLAQQLRQRTGESQPFAAALAVANIQATATPSPTPTEQPSATPTSTPIELPSFTPSRDAVRGRVEGTRLLLEVPIYS